MGQRYGNIVGWGKYVPERVITNADLEAMIDTTDEWIVERTGIRERHVVSEGETASQMAVEAAREALEMAGVRARDLGLIIVATSSPDYLTPPVSSQVQHALGAKDVGAFTLVAGCPGFVYGIATAQQFIETGAHDNVLVVGSELITRYVDYTDRTTCVLFGCGSRSGRFGSRSFPRSASRRRWSRASEGGWCHRLAESDAPLRSHPIPSRGKARRRVGR